MPHGASECRCGKQLNDPRDFDAALLAKIGATIEQAPVVLSHLAEILSAFPSGHVSEMAVFRPVADRSTLIGMFLMG